MTAGFAADRKLAVTFDDLPCAGPCASLEEARSVTDRLLGVLTREKAPAIGFVNGIQLDAVAAEREARIALLSRWVAAGMTLGNHTYSHPDLNATALEAYQDDVLKGEPVIRELMGGRSNRLFFRHPFTRTGGPDKKERFEAFLAKHGYRIAPFTLEHSDWLYNAAFVNARKRGDAAAQERIRITSLAHLERAFEHVERVSQDLFGREIPQVLLIHANALNAECLREMLALARKRGYTFVTLEEALRDAAYATPDLYTGKFGPSWLHRWGVALGKKTPMKGEPEPPSWVSEAAAN